MAAAFKVAGREQPKLKLHSLRRRLRSKEYVPELKGMSVRPTAIQFPSKSLPRQLILAHKQEHYKKTSRKSGISEFRVQKSRIST
jgi:hypothetical protein